jgi:hypothetical protein
MSFRECDAPRAWIFGGELTAWVPVLPSFTWVHCFYQDMFTLCQSHCDILACIPGLATTSGGDGMDLALKYMRSDAHGLLHPRPIVTGA